MEQLENKQNRREGQLKLNGRVKDGTAREQNQLERTMCIYEHCSWLKEANILKKQNRYHEKVEQLLIRDHMDQYVLVINRRTSHQLCNHTLQLWPNHVEEGGGCTVYVGRMLHNTVGGALTAALHHHSARSPVIHLTQTHTSGAPSGHPYPRPSPHNP